MMMNGITAIVLSCLGLFSVTSAQFLQDGQCDTQIGLQSNFNPDQFIGTWYEIGTSEERNDGECSDWEISRTDVTNFVFIYSGVLKDIREREEIATTFETGSARFTLLNYGENGTSADFWILGTNYQDYTIVYRCENVGTTQRNLFITLLGRDSTINSIFGNAMNNIVASLGVDLNDLNNADHSEEACFALPSFSPGEAVVLPGQCDQNISRLTSFDVASFLGTWHEVYSYYSENAGGTCAKADYSLGSGGVVNVVNSQVLNQTLDTVTGTASIVDGVTGMLLVQLEILPGVFVSTNLWVIDTDYVNYAISYSCENLGNNTKRVFSWIVSRDVQLSPVAETAVNAVVDSILDLNFAYYEPSNQSADACFYFPEFSSDSVVEFPGECDLTIPAVAGFDAQRYMGLWHDIVSYPTSFQYGECNNAYYTLVNGVVDVFNTQVINQTLDTITGVGEVVSEDGSAKLAVTFPIEGTNFTVTTSYWVLATDYDSYSLVYTCEYNSLTNTRQVFSWKLSRTKTLTNAANAAMDQVIAGIPVLDERYYITRDQSPDACFYFPEPEAGVPIEFPGFCDQNISAVPNFNLNSFQGSWFEIETYPKENVGQCVQHQFTISGTSALNIASSFIQDQFLSTSTGALTFTSGDNSGKFQISINVGNNEETVIPFWILATDYNDYALAYSCMDLEGENDYRAVNVWKLSRNQQQLSATAITAINSVMENIEVLDQRYFETMDQTEEGCRALPDIPEGQPIIIDGQCDPNIQVVQNFSAGDYLGTWHLIESYWSAFQNGDCSDATYSAGEDGTVVVFNTQVVNQTLDVITGSAVVIDNAKLLVTFPNAPPIEYWVIDTDYTSYALVYSCINLSNTTHQVWSWKMSRNRFLTATAIANINRAVEDVWVLNERYYYTVDNSDQACFYFPEANGQPILFRGQCDETIQVFTNFNAVAYMGLWYDIQSYPQAFQDGSCSTANYTLTDVVEVFNTQVINQRLDTITGSAVPLQSDNGEAKLNVTFPIEIFPGTFVDVYSPYWVLATDYTDYALVYACQNTGPDQRSVSSWKLSRTKSLSTQAETNINNVIASIDVLRQDYYEVKGHTDEDCFYYPEATGETVEFRGQCDNNIQALPNFDLERFTGQWNEIETYPKAEVGGQCVQHSFAASTISNTTLLLTSNQVFNSETLVSNSGEIVLSSSDGSGRFVLSINVNNQIITIPYWIIDTDYTSYALVYSCMDRGEETRAVYSWKLSRSTSLSIDSNTAIAAAMAPINVLDQQYYEPISHSDNSCFYLPNTGANEPTIFPGQCDQNITTVSDFSAGDYLGQWHLIESYYSEFQNGDCNDAQYSLQADGTVLVFNTQVINQTLDTITGVAEIIGEAKLLVTFPDAPFPIEYWILDTDYTSFALIYSCVNLDNNRQQVWSWKMSRTRSLTTEAVNRINEAISEVRVLDNRYYGVIDNTDAACFYYPEANGQPVVFRGQCDESIQVVTNFNAVAYMGLWNDIQSYPQPFQDGSCATAFYTLTDVVEVFNTQVIDQRLDTIIGSAVPLESDNGEAKLNVTFPIEIFPGNFVDVYSPYWVLSTDYTDYAFVYACQNIGPDQRSVSSWKLSRTRTLSTVAQANINSIIESIDILREDYYEVKGHTDDDCFYYPEPNGEPVVYRGQCDNTIQALPNFDLEQFIGTWNEIETYPKEQAGGQCINHEFSASPTSITTLQLVSNQVLNTETLVTNTGLLVLDSTDGSGRFSLTMSVGNQTINMPYWIIDTDYTDYALIYSCMNRDTETRAVYSWKLSRSSEISNNGNTAINTAMAAVDVLDQQYYEPVSQTPASCFYLPVEINPNEPAIFTGQCDANIQVVQNFDATRFSGRWFDIESYFDGYTGTCIDGTFTQNNNGYSVSMTQVVNQTLDVTSSTATLSADNSGKLIVTSNGEQYEYWILDTDYESWALIYSCQDVNVNQRRVRSWKMSRTRQLSDAANTAINAIIDVVNVLNEQFYLIRDHSESGCFYYPEPDSNPVTFRGRCDETVQVVQNFDVEAYLGQWYDIESYPQLFQDGQCATALYTLGDNGVDVYNTQVVNQQLDVINGLAVVASNDSSAKLTVTFEVAGFLVESPYWVLSTDYTTYSLVYSCVEINEEYKRVSSWKLSRTRSLPAAAEQQINQVMINNPVLQQEYFRDTGHSEDDCFFYPDNNGGPVILDGQCPSSDNIDVVEGFDLSLFAGSWYEVSRFPSEEQTGDCTSANFILATNDSISITRNIIYNERLNVATGTGTVSADERGIITASLTSDQFTANFNLYVLDTDYDEFALLYACTEVGNEQKQVYSWKLSRSQAALSETANDRISSIVTSNTDLFELYYESTDQTNDACFYYPEFEVLPPVIELPGPCNENIRGISGFDANAYLGRWFEIERYPQLFQFGACDQATYSTGNNVVDVYNTHVVNRTLLIQEGFAEVASTDGTGHLQVTFEVNGFINIANYYILATDYTSYALVYSCRNLDNGDREVYSWKLSRHRALSNAANQAITTTIAETQGLLEDYYIPTSQSDEDCFYVPEPNPDNFVRFRGQCEDISGVQNFNIQNYLGIWHEMERYPTGGDDGVCSRADFSATGNQYQVVDTTVYDLQGDLLTSTVTVNNDGRIRRTSGGIDTDLWVLATDYDSYALLYSCENIDDEYRRVWSAKHSRTRSLAPAAEVAIAEILAANDLLYQEHYLEVDQSDEACFYYPDATGGPVVLPGQCDDNIPVVQDFRMEEYTGTWYQTERYPQMWETGNCTGARYTINEETGFVDVINWQVIDGELDAIEGNASLSSSDGTAKFLVELPSRAADAEEGETVQMELYVLKTDYVSYSLVYSCVNINQYQRQLGVWKLSRTRDMPATGTSEINAHIATRAELDQRYFVPVGQDEDCEEPSSAFVFKSSIILLLVCSFLQVFT